MKDHLKEKLEGDEKSAKKLMKLHEKGVSYDYLWDNTIQSQVIVFYMIYHLLVISKFIITCL